MSLELAIQENTATMKQLIAVLQSGHAVQLTEGAATAAVAEFAAPQTEERPKRTRAPKAEAGNEPAASTAPSTAITGHSATPQQAGASAPTPPAIAFGDVTKKIVELNKSQKPGHGRDGVLAVIKHFLGTTEGKKVPDLEAVGKNAEIIAFVDAMLTAEAADDLGI